MFLKPMIKMPDLACEVMDHTVNIPDLLTKLILHGDAPTV